MIRALLIVLLCAGSVAAATYNAADCNRDTVNALINGPGEDATHHVAVNGDVIQLPSCSVTWTTAITVASGIGITIQGTGTPNTAASVVGASVSCTATAITDNITSQAHMFLMQPTTSSSTSRISCMKLLGQAGLGSNAISDPIAIAGTCNASTCPNIRVDNITFDISLQDLSSDSGGVMVTDNVFGVLDHNTATASFSKRGMEFVNYNNSAWKGVGAYGDNSWAAAGSSGTAQTLYVENNSWNTNVTPTETEANVLGGEGGGRIALRFNTCLNCAVGLSNHGTESNGRPRGARQGEFYGNTFTCGTGFCQGVGARSGVYIMFGNTFTNKVNEFLALDEFRNDVIWGPPWNQCNGSGPYDDNSVSPPICLDQPSRSGGTLLSGSPTPTPTGWPGQVIDPSYEWNDTSAIAPDVTVEARYSPPMVANQDWYTDNSGGVSKIQTSATSPFNGTSGAGFGTKARRPTSCTTGVVYWATDEGSWNTSGNSFGQGNLYRCVSANTWSASPIYTPYTYPHPLVSGGATVPTVTTTSATSVTSSSASSGGNVTSDGGASVTARGVCYATTANPTTPCTSDGTGTGTYTSSLTSLSPGTLYHYQAYATNSAGTSYGTDLTFTTSVAVPTVTTTTASSITSTTAVAGGNVTNDGGGSVTFRGTCYGTSANPLVSGSHTTDGTGTGIYTSSISGLSASTLYHYRACASNSAGDGYGTDLTFTTSSGGTNIPSAISGPVMVRGGVVIR